LRREDENVYEMLKSIGLIKRIESVFLFYGVSKVNQLNSVRAKIRRKMASNRIDFLKESNEKKEEEKIQDFKKGFNNQAEHT